MYKLNFAPDIPFRAHEIIYLYYICFDHFSVLGISVMSQWSMDDVKSSPIFPTHKYISIKTRIPIKTRI